MMAAAGLTSRLPRNAASTSFPMAAGGKDLTQDSKCISIDGLLADGGLDLQEGDLQLTRCQDSIGLEHVPIDH